MKISMGLCLIITLLLIEKTMKAQNEYKFESTSNCIKYIEKNGLTLEDIDTTIFIESEMGLLYSLPNDEVVMIPSDFRDDYVGIIFCNRNAFLRARDSGFFSLPEQYLSMWEKESKRLINITENLNNYLVLLKNNLKLDQVGFDVYSLRNIYDKLLSYLNISNIAPSDKELTVFSFSLVLMDYYVREKKAKWNLLKRYEIYNQYYYPTLIRENKSLDIYSCLCTSLEMKGGNFQLFLDLAEFNTD